MPLIDSMVFAKFSHKDNRFDVFDVKQVRHKNLF